MTRHSLPLRAHEQLVPIGLNGLHAHVGGKVVGAEMELERDPFKRINPRKNTHAPSRLAVIPRCCWPSSVVVDAVETVAEGSATECANSRTEAQQSSSATRALMSIGIGTVRSVSLF